jgi:hypothetical protein
MFEKFLPLTRRMMFCTARCFYQLQLYSHKFCVLILKVICVISVNSVASRTQARYPGVMWHESQTASHILESACTFVLSQCVHKVEIYMLYVTGMNCLLWFVTVSTVLHKPFLL